MNNLVPIADPVAAFLLDELLTRIEMLEKGLDRIHPSWRENWHDPNCQCSLCT